MKITRLQLINFKRFTHLTIDQIPGDAKLVLLIGSNGSGKSSIFDAFDYLNKSGRNTINGVLLSEYYYKNGQTPEINIDLSDNRQIKKKNEIFHITGEELGPSFIGRSSIRIVPRIANNAIPENVKSNGDSPTTFIDPDYRFTNDVFMYIQQIDNALREPVFSGKSADTLKIFRDFIQPLNSSLINIFGGTDETTIQIAEFENAAVPNRSGKLIFRKGDSKINYDLLSHGEKQVVILLLNFIVRKEYYNDAIIFIDEMDCHLNTSLQERLLHEIVSVWIPDNAQLWTASHALGFIDYAKHAENAAIIDLDLLNFDEPQTVLPTSKDSLEVYNIAVPKIMSKRILKGYKLVVVENQNDEYYNLALGEEGGYLFLPANNNTEVFLTIKHDKDKIGLRDRDYLKPEEIKAVQEKFNNLRILHYCTFENYIYHPDNLAELNLQGFDQVEYVADIVAQKNDKILNIVGELATARQTYVEFKEGIKNDKNIEPIIASLKSDALEDFYQYFNMKKDYNKSGYLQSIKYEVKDLVQTKWFKDKIEAILKGN